MFAWWVWVWLGGTHIALVRTLPALLLLVWGGGVGGLGTLLGPEETPACRVFLVGRSWLWSSNALLWVWWRLVGLGCGCVLSVA